MLGVLTDYVAPRGVSSTSCDRLSQEDNPRNKPGESESPTSSALSDSPSSPAAQRLALPTDSVRRSIGTWQLAGMIFFMTAGGGYGLENLVKAAGPLPTIIAILITPWMWSLPLAMMTAELSSMIPEDGGFVLWVDAAFGKFWAFQVGWWSFVNTVIDNALYPVLFTDYLSIIFHFETSTAVFVRFAMLLGCTLVNLIGLDVVGWASIVLTLITIFPFILLTAFGFTKTNPRIWTESVDEYSFGLLIATALWNFSGHDAAGTCAGEVEDVGNTYPKAMIIVLLTTIILFTLPIMASVTVNNVWEEWRDAFWVTAANRISGKWLGFLMVIGGVVMSIGMLVSIIATSSRGLYGMVRLNLIPRFFGKVSQTFHVPYVCVLAIALGTAAFIFLPFSMLIQIDSALYVLKAALEFAALVHLRTKWKDVERPFKIPGGHVGLYLMVIPAFLCIILMAITAGIWAWIGTAATVLAGILMYPLVQAYVQEREFYRPAPTSTQLQPQPPPSRSDSVELENLHTIRL